MNNRDLVNDFAIETSSFDKIATVLGHRDDEEKGVVWVRDAWTQIQRAERWDFMFQELSFNTAPGKAEYTLTEQNRKPGSKIDLTNLRVPSSKRYLNQVDINAIRFADTAGQPARLAEHPNETIRFNPIPDEVYTITADHWEAPVILTDDLDVPSMPEAYHKSIVWLAVKNYAREQGKEWQGLYTSATREFNHVYSDLLRFYLPAMKPPVPLVR